MFEHLPEDIAHGLAAARDRDERRGSRLCLHVDGEIYPLRRLWDTGFSIDADRAPALRGLVDLYDGPRHISHCLIVASGLDDDQRIFEFKRETPAGRNRVADFAVEGEAPAALLPRPA
jgi:hypothetical protein